MNSTDPETFPEKTLRFSATRYELTKRGSTSLLFFCQSIKEATNPNVAFVRRRVPFACLFPFFALCLSTQDFPKYFRSQASGIDLTDSMTVLFFCLSMVVLP